MKRKILLGVAICLVAISARADESTASVQKALKDQGFYYGEVTGKMDADTSAAIRRYQIRNGLKITGEVNAETEKSLATGSPASTSETARTVPRKVTPTVPSSNEEQPAPPSKNAMGMPSAPLPDGSGQRSQEAQPYRPVPPDGFSSGGELFANTPYEAAPPPVQREVVIGAQTLLARRGYYRSGIDGVYGPGLEFALRAYQSRTGIPPNGRLDMDTLAALGLLPGQRTPGLITPRRRPIVPPRGIVRGEWVPE